MLLRPRRRRQPKRDPAVAVMIDDVGRERLAADPIVGRAVRDEFLCLRKPQAEVADGLIEILRRGVLGAGVSSRPRSTQAAFCAQTLHHPVAGTVCPTKMLQPPVVAPALPRNCAQVAHF